MGIERDAAGEAAREELIVVARGGLPPLFLAVLVVVVVVRGFIFVAVEASGGLSRGTCGRADNN